LKIISKQAKQLLTHGKIFDTKNGNQSKHPSILDNPKISKELFKWVSSQSPGTVSSEEI
jgi:hypothetical protein